MCLSPRESNTEIKLGLAPTFPKDLKEIGIPFPKISGIDKWNIKNHGMVWNCYKYKLFVINTNCMVGF